MRSAKGFARFSSKFGPVEVETLASFLRFFGVITLVPGLWFVAGGMRVVVSGRIDERRRSAKSMKRGIPLVAVGILAFVAGTWLAGRLP